MLLTPLTTLILGRLPDCLSNSSFLFKDSAIIMWRIGDKGQPWWSPLLPLKKDVDVPFTKGDIHGLQMQVEIHQMKARLKPNLKRISKRKEWHFIESISHIYFDNHTFVFVGFVGVQCFLYQYNVVHDLPLRNETALVLGDDFGQKMLQSISYYYLSQHFVRSIAKRDGLKPWKWRGIGFFWNEC